MAKVEITIEISIEYEVEIEVEVEYEIELEVEVEVDVEEPVPVYDLCETSDWESWGAGVKVPARGWYAQFGTKARVDFDDLQVDSDGNLAGTGSDPNGGFELYGQMNKEGYFTFAKTYYGAHTVMYRGRYRQGVMTGKWEIPGNCDGTFNICPGWQKWKGGFWQFGQSTEMVLDQMYVGESGVVGRGWDNVGAFVINGWVDGDQVAFAKQYIGQHTVFYNGQWNGNYISGRWQIPGNCDGSFSLKACRQ